MLKKLSVKELACYIASGVIALVGLVFLIIGIVADNLGVESPLYKMQAAFPWRYLGFIIIAVAVVFAIIVLSVFAKKVDRITDKELRRKQRLNAMMSDIDKQEEIVVSDGKIVNEEKKVEEQEEEVETKPIEPIAPKAEEAKIDQPVETKVEDTQPSQPVETKAEEAKASEPAEAKVEEANPVQPTEQKVEEPKVDNPNNNPNGVN